MALSLVIANKAYSSWSLRPWMLLKAFGIPFAETVIAMGQDDTRANMLKYAPTGKCPSLHDGEVSVWDSLSIFEYVAERFPEKAIWPKDVAARAYARSICAEMHSGFQGMRQHLPTQFRRPVRARELTEDAQADVVRMEALFAETRKRFGAGGPFLFGSFSAADAFFAPVINRLHVYDVTVTSATRAYMDAVLAHPAYVEWCEGAAKEEWALEKYESI